MCAGIAKCTVKVSVEQNANLVKLNFPLRRKAWLKLRGNITILDSQVWIHFHREVMSSCPNAEVGNPWHVCRTWHASTSNRHVSEASESCHVSSGTCLMSSITAL